MTQATTTTTTKTSVILSTDELLVAARTLGDKLHTAFMAGDGVGTWAMVQEMQCLAERARLVAELEKAEYKLINATKERVVLHTNDQEHTAQDTVNGLTTLENERYSLCQRTDANLNAILHLERVANSSLS